jgi:hypothetical protein
MRDPVIQRIDSVDGGSIVWMSDNSRQEGSQEARARTGDQITQKGRADQRPSDSQPHFPFGGFFDPRYFRMSAHDLKLSADQGNTDAQ